jgi:Skp family chaperone for outer membrane proteins
MQRLIAFTLAAVIGLLSAQPVIGQDTPEPTKIGFLNMRRVFQEYWKRENIEKALRARTDALEASVAREKGRLEEMADELATLNSDSDDYRTRVREMEIIRFQIKLDQEGELRRIQAEAKRKEALLYKEVVRECQAFGEGQGFAAIMLTAPLGPDFEKSAELDIVVATRAVLWHDDRLDVTGKVLEFLNAGKPR